jgi:F-type H+-transporting ATPase subunit alpha
VLKQGQYQPMPVEQQVMIIYAVTNGYIDDVPVAQVREWERGFHDFMKAKHPKLGESIRTGKVLTKEIEEELKKAIEEYRQIASR